LEYRTSRVAWGAGFVLFAAARVAAVAGRPAAGWFDTYGYLHGLSFVGHGRPWVVPLLYDVVTGDGARIAVQCAIAIVCWCTLAYVAATVVRQAWLRAVIAAVILLIGISPEVTRWDLALLSESVAVSLTVAAIACWIVFAKHATTARMLAVWVVTLLWAFTRSAHLLLLPVLLALLAVSLLWRSNRRSRGLLLLALVPVTVWGLICVRNDPGVTESNLYLMLEIRVFGNADSTRYFAQHGMPVNAAMLRHRGIVPRSKVPPDLVRYARVPPGFAVPEAIVTGGRPLIRWMRKEGAITYLKWLASQPGEVVAAPLKRLDILVTPKLEYMTPPTRSRAVLPRFATRPLFENRALYLVSLSAALLGAIAAVVFKLRSRPLAVAWCIIGLSFALVYIVFFGSPVETARHAIVASVAGRVGILLALAYTADLYWAARNRVELLESAEVSR
jgi:hypothetical protein